MNEPESIKVVLVGESGVGKTSIISQFTSKKFDPHRETSLSAQFISKTVSYNENSKKGKTHPRQNGTQDTENAFCALLRKCHIC